MVHSAGSDTGTVEIEVRQANVSYGGTTWIMFQRRNFTRSSFISYHWYYESVKDSLTFIIFESDIGYHELYSVNSASNSVFPFKFSSVDTTKFFRYKDTGQPLDIKHRIEYTDPGNPSFPDMNYKYNFTIRAGIGLTCLNYSKSAMLSGSSADYYLEKFNETIITEIEEEPAIPVTSRLLQNYPNPFNPTTTINYSIPKQSYVTIKIFNAFGGEVTTLINEYKPAGNYEVEFNAVSLASGIYFYQLKSLDFIETKKMILLK